MASVLGFEYKKFTNILYKQPTDTKYNIFKIPKKNGGERIISAPTAKLKRVQSNLSKILGNALKEIEVGNHKFFNVNHALSHGFQKDKSIITNSLKHRNKRWVLNFDLADFFPSINFGRVTGYFEKNNRFSFPKEVANTIAHIACTDDGLPQGSPCSPVISNLIAQALDYRLSKLAKKCGCSYSRYADDITISSNSKVFPELVAKRETPDSNKWNLSEQILRIVNESGFQINDSKTRMQYKNSRQQVTGLIVNSKVNVKREVFKLVKAMCQSLYAGNVPFVKISNQKTSPYNLEQLRGLISHVVNVKNFHDKGNKREDFSSKQATSSKGFLRVAREFLDFTNFVESPCPVILTEGETDKLYIYCALKQFFNIYPTLVTNNAKKNILLKLFNYSKQTNLIQSLAGGTGDLKNLITHYDKRLHKFQDKQRFEDFFKTSYKSPTILIVDNDSGVKGKSGLFSVAGNQSKPPQNIDGSKAFYHIKKNLYLIPTPSTGAADSDIEDLLGSQIYSINLKGKTFCKSEQGFEEKKNFGKSRLANHMYKKRDLYDFSGIKPILDSIVEIMQDYQKNKATYF